MQCQLGCRNANDTPTIPRRLHTSTGSSPVILAVKLAQYTDLTTKIQRSELLSDFAVISMGAHYDFSAAWDNRRQGAAHGHE
jgi:hypothetical protein